MLSAADLPGVLATLPTIAVSTTFTRRVPAFALFSWTAKGEPAATGADLRSEGNRVVILRLR